MSSLAARWRPTVFNDVVGQPHIVPILRAMVREDDVPSTLLFSGSRGTGKTTCARIFAAALNAPNADGDVDLLSDVAKEVLAGNSPVVLEIDAASNGLVADVRAIRDTLAFGHSGRWRVVLLDEAHSMSREAFNALLKILEEPPPRTAFVLLTTEPHKILDTVRSRAMEFDFRRIADGDLVSRLRKVVETENIEVEPALLAEIASRSDGGLRDAIMTLDHVRRLGVKSVREFHESFGIVDVSVPLLVAAIKGDVVAGVQWIDRFFSVSPDTRALVKDLTATLRDLLVLNGGGTVTTTEKRLEALRLISQKVSSEQAVALLHLVWDLSARLGAAYDEQRSLVDLFFSKTLSVFRPAVSQLSAPITPQTKPAKEPTLSLGDMAAMLKE